jgi:hypothetical protein
LGLSIASPAAKPVRADVLIVSNIYPSATAAPVHAMGIDPNGRVLAIGSHEAVRAALDERGSNYVETVIAGTVIPGLIDAHGHLMGLGFALMQADLVGTRSRDEVLTRVREHARSLSPKTWITGRGWDQNDWPDARYPDAAILDLTFADRPVWLERIDGHAGWANSAALRAAGIDARTPDPVGGKILRNDQGQPTGILIDTAMALVDRAIPNPNKEQRRRALALALDRAASLGLTGVHDAGTSLDDLALMREFANNQQLPLRIYAMADGDAAAFQQLCRKGPYRHESGRLAMRAVKLYADGALGSRGAALLKPYSDDADNRGLLIQPEDRLRALIARAAECKIQPAVHAIGDRANRIVLDAFANLSDAQRKRLRPRVEHAQIVDPGDLKRFAEFGIIASMQPTHATSDMPWAAARVGQDRLRGAYAWQTLIDSGAAMALGSDFPVESVDPKLGLYAAVSRQDSSGQPDGGWLPNERMSFAEALDGFTRGAAYAAHLENELGTLDVGKRADFVVLNANPFELKNRGLLALQVRSTWLDGRKVSGR